MSEHRIPIIIRFIIVVLILVGAGYVFVTMLIMPSLKKKAASYATQKAVEVMITRSGNTAEQQQIKEIYESIEEEDRQVVEEIAEKHLDAQTAVEVTTYISNNDMEGLQRYAEETLSEEEMAELMQLYDKYKDQIEAEMQHLSETIP